LQLQHFGIAEFIDRRRAHGCWNRGHLLKRNLKKSGACSGGAPRVGTPKLALDECFIHVTPSPVLTDFKRPHNWVLGLMKVLPCVVIRRWIAATDVTARQTKPQMQPRRTDS